MDNGTPGKAPKINVPRPQQSGQLTDQTPTPTRIERIANELISTLEIDSRENPFDVHFRKATEAVKSGLDGLPSSLSLAEEETLNTPSVFPSSTLHTPVVPFTATAGPALSKPVRPSKKSRSKVSSRPLVKSYKPIVPNNPQGSAEVLLRTPSGEVFKLYNLPVANQTEVKENTTLTKAGHREFQKSCSRRKSGPQLSQLIIGNSRSSEETSPHVLDLNNVNAGGEQIYKKQELKERNKFSARRSRNKKKEFLLRLEKEWKHFKLENLHLREEITKLKQILQHHTDCHVAIVKNQQDMIRSLIEPSATRTLYPDITSSGRIKIRPVSNLVPNRVRKGDQSVVNVAAQALTGEIVRELIDAGHTAPQTHEEESDASTLSMMRGQDGDNGIPVLPIVHTASIESRTSPSSTYLYSKTDNLVSFTKRGSVSVRTRDVTSEMTTHLTTTYSKECDNLPTVVTSASTNRLSELARMIPSTTISFPAMQSSSQVLLQPMSTVDRSVHESATNVGSTDAIGNGATIELPVNTTDLHPVSAHGGSTYTCQDRQISVYVMQPGSGTSVETIHPSTDTVSVPLMSPPQAFPEDLRTNVTPYNKLKRRSSRNEGSAGPAKQRMKDKLQELKRKMEEDREREKFILDCRQENRNKFR